MWTHVLGSPGTVLPGGTQHLVASCGPLPLREGPPASLPLLGSATALAGVIFENPTPLSNFLEICQWITNLPAKGRRDGSAPVYSPCPVSSSLHRMLALLLLTPGSTSMAQTLVLPVSFPGPPPAFLRSNRAHCISAHVIPVSTENSIRDGCEATYALL